MSATGGEGRFATRVVWTAVLLGIALRAPFLGTRFGLDDDEIYTLRNAEQVAVEPPPPGVRGWPLTFWATRALVELGGAHEWTLRLFPFVCGVATLLLAAALARRMFGKREAAAAALLLALWPWHVYYSGLARYYAPVFLFSLWTLERAWTARRRRRPGAGCGAVLAGAAAFLCHPTGAIAWVSLLPGGLARARRALASRLRVLVALCVVGLAVALVTPRLAAPVGGVLSGASGHGYDAVRFVLGLGFNATPLLLAAAALGALVLVRERHEAAAPLLLLAAAAPVSLLFLALAGFSVQPRYALVSFPAVVLLAARGGAQLCSTPSSRRAGALLAAALLLPFLPGVVSHEIDGDRHDWRGVAALLAPQLDAGTVVFAEGHSLLQALLWGLDRRLPPGEGTPPFPAAFEEAPPPPEMLRAVRSSGRDVFVVLPEVLAENLNRIGGDACDRFLRERTFLVAKVGRERWDYHRNVLRVYRTRGGAGSGRERDR